ncbi:MAG: tetratricopeptide repeat protein [bacterium]
MGTVTFLFTDVEGSTDLVRALGDQAYSTVLAVHRGLLRETFGRHHGQEIDTQGDAFFVAFADAADAIAAALAIQESVQTQRWPGGAPVRVRLGIHTGDPVSTGTGYVGMDVHRAARICSAGYGGQILVSQTTRDAVGNRLPAQATLRLLGRYRLKDLQEPEALYQLVHPALAVAFPPPRTLDAIPNNLPIQLTSFIGRVREIADVGRLFSTTRLLTLTGPGGCGKTRLALQAAAELVDEFADGVWLVELAALTDPGLVTQAAAGVLGMREETGRPLGASLADAVRSKRLLLILDNCEHLIDASARLAESLLVASSGLKVLATGREPLGIAGEMIYRVPSLAVPDVSQQLTPPDLNKTEAARLFVERAAFARPDLRLTDADAPAVARICVALDGIPLAIEMAAARLRTLSVGQIAQRISDRFGLLTGGSRTALPRQQTLQAVLDWSYELLTDAERAALRALSVFPAGFTLEAAEDVCAGPRIRRGQVLHLVGQLVDKSMITAETHAADARYRMLQTVRQYGLERLVQEGEAAEIRARQLASCLRLVTSLNMADRPEHEWVPVLDLEHDNLRAGLAWGLEGGNILSVLRLAAGLAPFWLVRGYWSEGRRWLEAALTAGISLDPEVQARGLLGLARIAEYQGDYGDAKTFSEAGLALQQHLGDSREVAGALRTLGNIAYARSDYGAARTLYEESLVYGRATRDPRIIAATLINLAIVAEHQAEYARAAALGRESLDLFRSVDDRRGTAFALHVLGLLAIDQGDHDGSAPLFEESLQLRRDLGDRRGISGSLHSLGLIARAHGDLTRAQALHEESLTLRRDLGDKQGVGASLSSLAAIARDRGDPDAARHLWQESLALRQSIGDQAGIAECLERLAAIAPDPADAVRLFGAAAALRELIVAPGSPDNQEIIRQEIERLRPQLGDVLFDAAWQEGRRMPQTQAISLAQTPRGAVF